MIRLPNHHPADEMLMDYASGSLAESPSLVVATHMALCPGCRRSVAEMEALGGALLDDLEPEDLAPSCLERMMIRLDQPGTDVLPPRSRPAVGHPGAAQPGAAGLAASHPAAVPLLPRPLRDYLGDDMARLRWKPMMPGVRAVDLPMTSKGGAGARLVRMRGGASVPRHSHDGVELALILEGGFTDKLGHFLRGDLAVGDETVDHHPVADAEGCLCLSVTMGSLRFTGPVGRLLNTFMRF
jgi:putative transcriptional regulator